MSENKNSYPTQPDANGWFFETAEDKETGIRSREYDNGRKVKEIDLPGGKVATVRMLKGKESKEIKRYMGDDKEQYLTAALTVATTVDGTKQPFEFFEDLDMKYYNRLVSAYQDLNF